MEVHNYVYNYGFLADWKKANPNVKRGDILQSMEMSDYGTLAKWTNGETMMPLAQMMKFCNLWGVPITAFFMDEKAEDGSGYTPILPNAQIEPAGGWPDSNRKAGIKVCDPRTTLHMQSKLPEYIKTVRKTQPISNDAQQTNATVVKTEEVTQNERMRYLDIIEKLNDRVMKLSKDNIALHEELAKLKNEDGYHYSFAAEPLPRP